MHQVSDYDSNTSDDDQVELDMEDGDLTLDGPPIPLVLVKSDRDLAGLYRRYRQGRFVIDPEWQRKYVWKEKRASRLIESFLMDLPIPVVYLAATDTGNSEVIDGLQRLTSVFKYFANEYPLIGLEMRSDLNGKRFEDLSSTDQAKLEDATLQTLELPKHTRSDLRFLIFERLNTGGVKLNEMEIRNCLYRGSLNNLLKELAELDEFKSCVNQKNLGERMQDRWLALRFLAFYEKTYIKAKKGLKAFCNDFLETYKDAPEDKLKEFRKVFKHSMRACYTVFGDKAFRLRRASTKSVRGGEWAPRINATVFQVLSVSMTEYDLGQITRAADRIKEAYLDLLSTDSRWIECVGQSTGDPSKIEYSFKVWGELLHHAIGQEVPNDTQRLFTYQLKEEMFKQNPSCSICSQKIQLINDAALDHTVHYWKGGQTVPENARLAHRQCNWQRSRTD